MLSSRDIELMNEISKVRPKSQPRNYFEVLQHMKSNDDHVYGRRCIGTLINGRMRQYWIRPNDSIKNHISLSHSCYSTVNTFKRGGSVMKNKHNGSKYKWYHHSSKLVTGLGGLYTDLDAKNIGLKYGRQLISIYPHLLDMADLPEPSFVIDSGHGLHIIWLFTHEVVIHSPKILPMWQEVEDLFVHRLAKASLNLLGTSKLVDSKVHDCTRYLRIPQSYNCKDFGNKLYVKTLVDNRVSYSLTGYHSGLYYDYIGQHSRKWVDNLFINKKRSQARNQGNKTNGTASSSKVSSGLVERNDKLGKQAYLIINRLADYKEIIKIRNKEHIYTGYRNELIFLYAVDRSRLNGKNSILHDVQDINGLFHNPLDKNEINQILRISGRHTSLLSKYHYTNAMIISNHHLGLTAQEQRHMRTLISTRERKQRKAIANHKSSIRCHKWRKKKGLIGSMTKVKWQRKKLINNAVKLLKSHSKSATARIIGINRKTLNRWLTSYIKVGHFMKRS